MNPLSMLNMSSKLVLVTGASSGIGRSVAIQLSRAGAQVILNGRNADELRRTVAAMEGQEQHTIAQFDLANTDAIPAWITEACTRIGRPIDGLVHSAGIANRMPLRAISRSSLETLFETNVFATIALLRGATAKSNCPASGNSIVILSSAAALAGSPGLIGYAASKGALHGMLKSAAAELAPKKVRVNCIAPGYVLTPMMSASEESLPNFEAIQAKQYLGWIKPEEVAAAALFLLSDAAAKVTGTILTMDGGLLS
jgi:NAD(P)-dependent dehydrogenase (short-subunit alcohol dehydrogenase family)